LEPDEVPLLPYPELDEPVLEPVLEPYPELDEPVLDPYPVFPVLDEELMVP
jgi:hypothetical protein